MTRPVEPASPVNEPLLESLRIQAAAVVAQQAALEELEFKLADRQAVLNRQELQLADRLEHQRQQLLDLQEQIAQARASLREKRHAFAALSAEQETELSAIRREVEERRQKVEHRELRMLRFWDSFKQRLRRQQRSLARDRERQLAELHRQREDHVAEREGFVRARRAFYTQAELLKRQLAEGHDKLTGIEDDLRVREAEVGQRQHETALREKALAAKERRHAEERQREAAERYHLRQEIGYLEARANHAREALARMTEVERLIVPAIDPREVDLGRVAEDLSDHRRVLTEQMSRFCRLQSEWEEHRAAGLAALDGLAAAHEDRELALRDRDLELIEGEEQLTLDRATLDRLGYRIEADRLRAMVDVASARADADRRTAELAARERELLHREENLAELYRTWGRRRQQEATQLREARDECAAAREEWIGLRDQWLRARVRLTQDREELSAQQLALEQYRREVIDVSDRSEVAARRLERLRRQWQSKVSADGKELRRLGATLAAEAGQLDGKSATLVRRESSLHQRAGDLNDLLAVAERERLAAAIVRAQAADEAIQSRELRTLYDGQIAHLRDQLDRLAGLLIEAAPMARARAA